MAKSAEDVLYGSLTEKKLPFDLITEKRALKGVRGERFALDVKTFRTTKGMVRLTEIAQLVFTGRSAVQFYKEILPKIPKAEKDVLEKFEGKRAVFYFLGKKRYLQAKLEKITPYFLILYLNRNGSHEYRVVYKLALAGVSPFSPYSLISEPEETVSFSSFAGSWREEVKELEKMIAKTYRNTRKMGMDFLITLLLRDGREVKGLWRAKSNTNFVFRVYSPDPDKKETMIIYKHAVEDYF